MAGITLGDLATSYQMRRDNVRLRADMLRLTTELSTGHKSDVSTAVSGDFAPITGIKHQLTMLKGYDTVAKEASLFATYASTSLERMQTASTDLAPQLLTAGASGAQTFFDGLVSDVVNQFESSVRALNLQVGGRAIFAGAATDKSPLPDPETMLNDIKAAVAGETTAEGVVAQVEAWFGPGGGFETTQYGGSTTPLTPFRVGDGVRVNFDTTVLDAPIRDTLKGLAMASLLADGPLVADIKEQSKLAMRSSEVLMSSQGGLVALQANVGNVEAAVEKAAVRNSAELTQLEIARNKLTAIDPFQTATELTNLEVQIETLYTMTARLSRLKLTDFLR